MSQVKRKRKGDGRTYLVLADDTPEFIVALRYAGKLAALRHGHLAVAKITEPTEFLGWGGVEEAVRIEAREKAERHMEQLAQKVQVETGITPSLIIREGVKTDEMIAICKSNPAICALVLGASGDGNNPMVSFFTSKGLGQINVPVVIVPGNLSEEFLAALT